MIHWFHSLEKTYGVVLYVYAVPLVPVMTDRITLSWFWFRFRFLKSEWEGSSFSSLSPRWFQFWFQFWKYSVFIWSRSSTINQDRNQQLTVVFNPCYFVKNVFWFWFQFQFHTNGTRNVVPRQVLQIKPCSSNSDFQILSHFGSGFANFNQWFLT